MASAQRLGLDRPLVFHPSKMIDVVDVKVVEAAAAGPDEAVEARHLPEQFADPGHFWEARRSIRRARACGNRAAE